MATGLVSEGHEQRAVLVGSPDLKDDPRWYAELGTPFDRESLVQASAKRQSGDMVF